MTFFRFSKITLKKWCKKMNPVKVTFTCFFYIQKCTKFPLEIKKSNYKAYCAFFVTFQNDMSGFVCVYRTRFLVYCLVKHITKYFDSYNLNATNLSYVIFCHFPFSFTQIYTNLKQQTKANFWALLRWNYVRNAHSMCVLLVYLVIY